MNGSFFYSTFIFILISIIFIIFCFSSAVTTLSYSNNEITFSDDLIILPEDIYFSTSKFLWPTPRPYHYNFIFWI